MTRNLVIVESPAKARTIKRILGSNYDIKASMGHVRDLPRKSLGVDVKDNFAPRYVVPRPKGKIVREIKEAAGRSSAIYLATDPDREGEAISWHLAVAAKLGQDETPVHRVVFHEITKEAVKNAFKHPRSIDMDRVNAQQARRILDRLVGYRLSPLLWRKVQRGLSAGRVQSAALKMVVDREQEIETFVSEEYWTVEVELSPLDDQLRFKARVVSLANGKKLDISNKGKTDKVTAHLGKAEYTVRSVKTRQVARQPAPPFITSTLQQEAWRKLHFSAKKTMAIAQQLYEGVALGKEGSVGLITYMRTDSIHVATAALTEVRAFIGEKYDMSYLPAKPRRFANKVKWAQEAHEAIHPTKVYREPESIAAFLSPDQLKVYDLIWKRMVASQMSSCLYHTTTAEIRAQLTPRGDYLLRATSSNLSFPGFVTIYSEGRDEREQDESSVPLPPLQSGDKLKYWGTFPEQHFTQPPLRYTEATLIKALEQEGIGRPSTYAPTLSIIQTRDYVNKMNGRLYPSELGTIVNGILAEHFPRIVDLGFTARMEEHLDEIAQGKLDWIALLRDFYTPFEDMLHNALLHIDRVDMTQPTDQTCPSCSRPMVIRMGRFGKFLACTGYPECKTTKPFLVRTGTPCPQCGAELVERVGKKKRVFYGCSNYPQCTFTTSYRPMPRPCPHCGKLLVLQRNGLARCIACRQEVDLSELDKASKQESDNSLKE